MGPVRHGSQAWKRTEIRNDTRTPLERADSAADHPRHWAISRQGSVVGLIGLHNWSHHHQRTKLGYDLEMVRGRFQDVGYFKALVLDPKLTLYDVEGRSFLSSAFVPIESMPNVLQWIASVNPVSTLVAAVRELFGNPVAPVTKHFWTLDHPVAAAWLACALILTLAVPGALGRYRARTSD